MPLDCLVAPRAARSLVTQSPRITSIASRARPFTMPTSPAATTSCAPSHEPTFSPDSDTTLLAKDTESLLAGGWQLDHERMGLTKTYFFKTYTKVQEQGSESSSHHDDRETPEFLFYPPGTSLIIYQKAGSLFVHWTTHNPRGLSVKDAVMARYCDEQAQSVGVVDRTQAQKCAPASP